MTFLPHPALDLLDEQFGVIGRHQLTDWMEESAVDGHVRRGTLVRVERAIYRVSGGALTPEGTAMAAVLRARPDARITGPLALALMDIDGFTRDDPFEVLTTPGRRLRNVDFNHRPDPTPGGGRRMFRALPLAFPTVSLVDSGRFAEELGERKLRLGLDVCRWRKLVSTTSVLKRARQLGRRDPGAAFFLDLLEDAGAEPESEGERRLAELLTVFDPPLEAQVWVTPTRRVDFLWRIYRLVVEYLGAVDHAYAAARAADAERSDELREVGYTVVPVTAADLDDPTALLAYLHAVATARAFELGLPAPRRTDAA